MDSTVQNKQIIALIIAAGMLDLAHTQYNKLKELTKNKGHVEIPLGEVWLRREITELYL